MFKDKALQPMTASEKVEENLKNTFSAYADVHVARLLNDDLLPVIMGKKVFVPTNKYLVELIASAFWRLMRANGESLGPTPTRKE